MMTSRRVGLPTQRSRHQLKGFSRRPAGRKNRRIKAGDLFPSSHRVGSRVPPNPTSLCLNEVATPLGAEVLRSRSGGLLKVMPPKSQRLFITRATRFAAGGYPIGLGSLRPRRFFGLGAAPRTCFHASQIMIAHNVRGDVPSGLAFPGPGLVAPALVARRVRAWFARSCKSSSARVKRSGSKIGPWDETSRNSRTHEDPRASVTTNKASSTSSRALLICAREGRVSSTKRSRYSHRFQRQSCSANHDGGAIANPPSALLTSATARLRLSCARSIQRQACSPKARRRRRRTPG